MRSLSRLRAVFAILGVGLFGGGAAAEATCYPQKAPANLIGRYFVHEYPDRKGPSRFSTAHIAGRSEEGGLITCFYDGRPGKLGQLAQILATDETYSFAWSLDPASGRRTVSSAEERACDLGGLGLCTARRGPSKPGQPVLVKEFERRCEDGVFVKIRRSIRYEGGDPALRSVWNAQVSRYAKSRHEIRYREDGAILSSVLQVGLQRSTPSRMVEEGDWEGPSCLPNQTS